MYNFNDPILKKYNRIVNKIIKEDWVDPKNLPYTNSEFKVGDLVSVEGENYVIVQINNDEAGCREVTDYSAVFKLTELTKITDHEVKEEREDSNPKTSEE
jgi:hypothetical protein